MQVNYVCGFLFCKFPLQNDHVLIVQKVAPKWQEKLWNGIGGKIEVGETSWEAMEREFREETGLVVRNWRNFAVEVHAEYRVQFYAARIDWSSDMAHKSHWRVNDNGEMTSWVMLNQLHKYELVGNLRWLIPLAQDWRKMFTTVNAISNISENPTW